MTDDGMYILTLDVESHITEATVTHRISVPAGDVTFTVHRDAQYAHQAEIMAVCRHLVTILEGIWADDIDANGPTVIDLRPGMNP